MEDVEREIEVLKALGMEFPPRTEQENKDPFTKEVNEIQMEIFK